MWHIPCCNLLLIRLNRDMRNSLSSGDPPLFKLLLQIPSHPLSIPPRFPRAPGLWFPHGLCVLCQCPQPSGSAMPTAGAKVRPFQWSLDQRDCLPCPEIIPLFKNSRYVVDSWSAGAFWGHLDACLVPHWVCYLCLCLPVEPSTSPY